MKGIMILLNYVLKGEKDPYLNFTCIVLAVKSSI